MNEDYLIRHQKPPRQEFAAELYRKISRPAPEKTGLATRVAPTALAFCVVLAASFLASLAARAAVISLLRDIGGVAFFETTDYPGADRPASVPEEILTLVEAQAQLPFSVGLPLWVPEGMAREESVRITRFSESHTPVTIIWRGIGAYLELTIGQAAEGHIVGLESLETVKINGQDAALVRGMWNADTKEWDRDEPWIGMTLIWARGEETYSLFSPQLSREELIRIAESIP
ncbi:MAG: DUF4367 domain-containing protein [Anaerolineales bacterium]|nr:DUF4367 domain-containing protein [Anaerolineales bacterium]